MPRWSRQSGAIQSHPPQPTYEDFDKTYVQWFDTRRGIRRFSRKQRSDGCADLLDIMDMIEILLEQHQMSFTQDNSYKWRMYFPHLFIKPEVGDEIRNTITGEMLRFLWDGPIDYDAEQAALENLYSTGYDYPDYAEVVDGEFTAPAIQFTIDGVESSEYAIHTDNIGDYLQQIPASELDGVEYPGFSIMEWLKDENGAYRETPTLRRLLFGERISEADAFSSGIPFGTWLYGIIPVQGYSKPKTCLVEYLHQGAGRDFWYKIVQDSLYCFGNPSIIMEDGHVGNFGNYRLPLRPATNI